jgi:hypothetical protein
MKLIAVLGATAVTQKQRYTLESAVYEEYFAFLAIASALDIPSENITIIGTEQTKALLLEPQYAIPTAILDNFILSSDHVDELFETCLSLIDEDTVLELTQGFRHLPMTLLLSGIAASSEKRLSDIYYAKTANPSCNPSKEVCTFEFISLASYLDRANLNAIIDSFCTSYVIPKLKISFKEFIPIEIKLHELSRHLLGNNIDQAIPSALKLKALLTPLHHSSISQSIKELHAEIEKLAMLSQRSESHRLYHGAHYFFEKNLLLHSVTNLFEAVLAFLDEYTRNEKIDLSYEDYKSHRTIRCSNEKKPYNRRNCLKKALKHFAEKNPTHPVLGIAMHKKLEVIDRLRNHSAHAHATEKSNESYKQHLADAFVFFDTIVQKQG